MSYLILAGYGDGEDMRDTLEASYACDVSCGHRYLRAIGFDPSDTASEETDYASPCRFTDGRETGDWPMVSYGYAPCPDTSIHEWCPACGALTEHGQGEDSEHFICDGAECDAPETVKPELERV